MSSTKPRITRTGGRASGMASGMASGRTGPPPIPPTMSTSYPSPDVYDEEDNNPEPVYASNPTPVSMPTSRVPAGARASARITPGAKSARLPAGGSTSSSTAKVGAKVGPPIPSKAPIRSPTARSPTARSPTARSPTARSPTARSPTAKPGPPPIPSKAPPKSPTVRSPSARDKGKKPLSNVYITNGSSIPADKWVGDIQTKVNEILSYIEPNQDKRNRYLDNEAMKIWTKAFTHETADYTNNNKTLETLGDAVLRLYFINYLMQKFPNLGQSGYTNLINYYQDRERQGLMSREYGLYDLIQINPKAIRDNKLAGDIYEAFFGALFKVGDLVLPGLGGVLANNLIVYLYNQENVDVRRTQKDPKSAITQMFNRFRFGDDAKSNYSKAIRNASLMKEDDGKYTYILILPPKVNQFLLDNGVNVDTTGEFTYSDGSVIIGEGSSRDSKEADLAAYKEAYAVLSDAGFTPEVAEDIKRDMDFEPLNRELVQEAEAKAQRQNLKLYFGTPKGEVSTVLLKGRLPNGEDINLVKYPFTVNETITSAREAALKEYINM